MESSPSRLEAFVTQALSGDIRRLDGEQRQARILAAAIQECSEKGFRSASMEEIAKRARVSTASLYRDFGTREMLLEDVTLFAAPMISVGLVETISQTDPRERLITLLVRHCVTYKKPHASWVFRAHASGELSEACGINEFGRNARTAIEEFWYSELQALQDAGHVALPDIPTAVNFLLGAVQRRSLLAMLLFGDDDMAKPDLETAAASAVDWLLTQYGTSSAPMAQPI